jgi:exosortase A
VTALHYDHVALSGRSAAYGWRKAGLTVLLFWIAILAVLGGTVGQLVRTWWGTSTYNHGFFVLPIALYLVWRGRQALTDSAPATMPVMLIPLAGAMALWLAGRAVQANIVEQVALVAILVTVAVLIIGWRAAWQIAFPLAFLGFMVPFGDELVPRLQNVTAMLATAMVRLAGVPIFSDGIMLMTPTGQFEVAEACAGIRFLIANIMISALFSHLSFRRWWKHTLFMAIGITMPVLANGVRAGGIVLLAFWTDNKVAAGADHLIYGWGFFTLVMLLIIAVGSLFTDRDRRLGLDAGARDIRQARAAWRPLPLAAAALLILSAPVYAWMIVGADPPSASPRHVMAPAIPAWTLKDGAGDWLPRFVGPDRTLLGRYRNGEREVDFFVAFYERQRDGAEIIYHANRLAGARPWVRMETGRHALDAGAINQVAYERLEGGAGRQSLVVSTYWVFGRFTPSPVAAKALQALATLFGEHRAAAVIAVAVPISESSDAAYATARDFLVAGNMAAYLSDLARDGR